MKKDSNAYIFIYSITLVVVVATLLSAVAILLSPRQQSNKDNEKKLSILKAAGIDNPDKDFEEYCKEMLLIDKEGNIIDSSNKAFDTELKNEIYKRDHNEDYSLPLFVIDVDGKETSVVPLYGSGLWGAIWGYIAVSSDGITLDGATFDHASETPGLGAEIVSDKFQSQFKGKSFMDNDVFVSIKVQKGGIASLPEEERQHAVDAISGGTITSRGVNDMIDNVLNMYLPYFKNKRAIVSTEQTDEMASQSAHNI